MSSIQEWWDGLSAKEQSDTRKAAADGTLDPGTKAALEEAGILRQSGTQQASSDTKMRHD